MVWNPRKVYSVRKVCVWFSFLAKPDKQSDFQLIFPTKGPQLRSTWTKARGNLALLKLSIFLSVYVFVVYRELSFTEKHPYELGGGLYDGVLV